MSANNTSIEQRNSQLCDDLRSKIKEEFDNCYSLLINKYRADQASATISTASTENTINCDYLNAIYNMLLKTLQRNMPYVQVGYINQARWQRQTSIVKAKFIDHALALKKANIIDALLSTITISLAELSGSFQNRDQNLNKYLEAANNICNAAIDCALSKSDAIRKVKKSSDNIPPGRLESALQLTKSELESICLHARVKVEINQLNNSKARDLATKQTDTEQTTPKPKSLIEKLRQQAISALRYSEFVDGKYRRRGYKPAFLLNTKLTNAKIVAEQRCINALSNLQLDETTTDMEFDKANSLCNDVYTALTKIIAELNKAKSEVATARLEFKKSEASFETRIDKLIKEFESKQTKLTKNGTPRSNLTREELQKQLKGQLKDIVNKPQSIDHNARVTSTMLSFGKR